MKDPYESLMTFKLMANSNKKSNRMKINYGKQNFEFPTCDSDKALQMYMY